MKARARIDKDGWYRCAKCAHKLGRYVGTSEKEVVFAEVKCHSCKTINFLTAGKEIAGNDASGVTFGNGGQD